MKDFAKDLARGSDMLEHLERKPMGMRMLHFLGTDIEMSMCRVGVIVAQQDIDCALLHVQMVY